ncbi:MAG: hypothetical protein WBE21_11100, partial [Candidatus Acidiferrales bacterium]
AVASRPHGQEVSEAALLVMSFVLQGDFILVPKVSALYAKPSPGLSLFACCGLQMCSLLECAIFVW